MPGKLEGRLTAEWRKPNSFIFIPNPDDPLRFTRKTERLVGLDTPICVPHAWGCGESLNAVKLEPLRWWQRRHT